MDPSLFKQPFAIKVDCFSITASLSYFMPLIAFIQSDYLSLIVLTYASFNRCYFDYFNVVIEQINFNL